jgi:hypothetical protein
MVKAELVSELEERWSNRQKKIEDAAQNRLMEHYRVLGWIVTDTRHGKPCDAEPRRSGPWVVSTGGITTPSRLDSDEVLYLEAKGTQSAGSTVLVTRGEVDHARTNPGRCMMGIWAGIEFDNDGEVDLLSGSFQVIPFSPHDHDLSAVS